ncbi:MAG: DUF4038 domain-containing protein [Chloroflexi bacterium]|nr:DUF4038 domain-containing protein [Chloroflexota bacterium]
MLTQGVSTLGRRQVGEWALHSKREYRNPFADVRVEGVFEAPSGERAIVPGFYDGDGLWKVRFNPGVGGVWRWRILSTPRDPELEAQGELHVVLGAARGYLQATPGRAWGLHFESGAPVFILGDTTYNLFGMAHCGGDVEGFMERRVAQGFNLLRVRLPVSPFHPPKGYSEWQTRRTWPWGGSEQKPLFDRFDLPYFATVDRVVQKAEALGLGLEMIMEAWGFEYPFNRRDVFVPEWEELWLRYLLARYDAYNCVFFWTLMNEYEYYPDGDWRYNPVADRWAMRMARWVKARAPHGHIVSVHNGPREPRFAERFALDPGAVDAIMFQDWGTRDAERGWLAAGIERQIQNSLYGWQGAAVFAEWGYERNPALPLNIPSHEFCDEEHTRRGAWRGAFCGLGIIHGFENSWGPFMDLAHDQPGLVYLQYVKKFFTEIVPFALLRPAPELVTLPGEEALGEAPLALATADRSTIVFYLPVGGPIALDMAGEPAAYTAQWYNPCTGELGPASAAMGVLEAPRVERKGHPQDWVLLLRRS